MPDRKKVIKGLEICIDRGPGEYTCNKCPYEVNGTNCEISLAKDALALLKEQANEIDIPDASIPEQFWTHYDPSEDVVACTSCLICGKDIPLRRYESGPRVCSECKKAVLSVTGLGDRGPDGEPGISHK